MKKYKTHYKGKGVMSNHKLFLVGLLSFALTLSASVTSTLAWFAVSDSGKVKFMNFNITESHALKIGLKDSDGEIHYYDSLNDSILHDYYPSYHAGSALADTSSMYQDLWLNENTDYETALPVLRAAYSQNGNYHSSEVATSGFFQFEFYFLADSDMYLFLDYEDTSAKALHEENLKTASSSSDVTVDELDNVVNATRVSFFSKDGFYIYEPNQLHSSNTVFGGILDATTKDGFYDYSSSKEIVYGEYDDEDKIIYDSPLEEDSELDIPRARATCFNAKHKAGVERFNYNKSVENGLSFKKEKTYTLEQLSLKDSQGSYDPSSTYPLARLKEDVTTRVVVTIYLEGWDLDVTEAIGNGAFTLNLGFVGLGAQFSD